MQLEVKAFQEHLNADREDLVSPDELQSFGLTPGASSCSGHGCSSCSCVVV